VHNALGFPDLLRLIDERSTTFRQVISSAPSLGAQVPTCPEWTLFDLARHIGEGRHRWAGIVAAGPASARPATEIPTAPEDRGALVGWLADATQLLLTALREAGPDGGCWTWWGDSQAPQTAGAVARHQLQELAVHTFDAQLTVGDPQPLPEEIAVDGVDEFLHTCVATTSAWPHPPALVDYHVSEGRSWRFRLSAEGARIGHVDGVADASARGTASELVLWFYARTQADDLKLDGDLQVFDRLIAWEPE
jgi:uncharacterized protein (TIGR03083 family)